MRNIRRQKIKIILQENEERSEVRVMGWVRTRRDSKGGFSFIEINDGSCLANLQVVADHNIDDFKSVSGDLSTGCCVGILGKLVHSPGKGQNVELQAFSIKIYGTADQEKYPLQKKNHSLEFLCN